MSWKPELKKRYRRLLSLLLSMGLILTGIPVLGAEPVILKAPGVEETAESVVITKGDVGAVYSDRYYEVGNTHPFVMKVSGLNRRDYNLFLDCGDGYKNSVKYSDYEMIDGEEVKYNLTYIIPDLSNFPDYSGTIEGSFSIYTGDGDYAFEDQPVSINYVKDEGELEASMEEKLFSSLQKETEFDLELSEQVTPKDVEYITLTSGDGKKAGEGKVLSSASKNVVFEDHRYDDVFSIDGINVGNIHTVLNVSMSASEKPAKGDYNIEVALKDGRKAAVTGKYRITDSPVLEGLDTEGCFYKRSDGTDQYIYFDQAGSYVNIRLRGASITDSLKPVVFTKKVVEEEEQEVPQTDKEPASVIFDGDTGSYIYRLKKINLDSFWRDPDTGIPKAALPDCFLKFEGDDDMGTFPIEISQTAHWVVFEYYNRKTDEYEIYFNSTEKDSAADDTQMTVSFNYQPYGEDVDPGETLATGTGEIVNGRLAVKLNDDDGKPFVPEQDGIYNLAFSSGRRYHMPDGVEDIEENMDQRIPDIIPHNNVKIQWFNFGEETVDTDEYAPAFNYWTEPGYVPEGSPVSISLDVIADGIDPGSMVIATLDSDSRKQVVLSSTGYRVQHSFNGKDHDYYSFSGEFKDALEEGVHSLDSNIRGVEGTRIYVLKSGEFYEDYQKATRLKDQVVLRIGSPNFGSDMKELCSGEPSENEVLNYFNDNYKLRLSDLAGKEIKGFSVSRAAYKDNELTLYLSGVPEEQYGINVKITKDGKTGKLIGSGKNYYTDRREREFLADEENGEYHELTPEDTGLIFMEDKYTLHGFYGLESEDGAAFPAVVRFYDPQTLDLVSELTSFGEGEKSYFSKADLSGLDPNKVYRITAVGADGSTAGKTGYAVYQKKGFVSIELEPSEIEMDMREEVKLKATVYMPEEGMDTTILWSSEDPAVATVDDTGRVRSMEAGETVIHARSLAGGQSAECRVKVNPVIKPVSVSLDRTELIMDLGKTEQLTASITPGDATDQTLIWSSSDPEIASVDSEGRVSSLVSGNAVITVSTNLGGKSASCRVNVYDGGPGYISLSVSKITVCPGSSTRLEASLPEDYAGDKALVWKTEGKGVVQVDMNGNVYARCKGEEDVTVYSWDNVHYASCRFIVRTGAISENEYIVPTKTKLSLSDYFGSEIMNKASSYKLDADKKTAVLKPNTKAGGYVLIAKKEGDVFLDALDPSGKSLSRITLHLVTPKVNSKKVTLTGVSANSTVSLNSMGLFGENLKIRGGELTPTSWMMKGKKAPATINSDAGELNITNPSGKIKLTAFFGSNGAGLKAKKMNITLILK